MPGLFLLQCVGIRYKKSYSKMQGTGETSGESTDSSPCCKPKYSFSVTHKWLYAMSRRT